VTMEEQMICGALELLNEEAKEDVALKGEESPSTLSPIDSEPETYQHHAEPRKSSKAYLAQDETDVLYVMGTSLNVTAELPDSPSVVRKLEEAEARYAVINESQNHASRLRNVSSTSAISDPIYIPSTSGGAFTSGKNGRPGSLTQNFSFAGSTMTSTSYPMKSKSFGAKDFKTSHQHRSGKDSPRKSSRSILAQQQPEETSSDASSDESQKPLVMKPLGTDSKQPRKGVSHRPPRPDTSSPHRKRAVQREESMSSRFSKIKSSIFGAPKEQQTPESSSPQSSYARKTKRPPVRYDLPTEDSSEPSQYFKDHGRPWKAVRAPTPLPPFGTEEYYKVIKSSNPSPTTSNESELGSTPDVISSKEEIYLSESHSYADSSHSAPKASTANTVVGPLFQRLHQCLLKKHLVHPVSLPLFLITSSSSRQTSSKVRHSHSYLQKFPETKKLQGRAANSSGEEAIFVPLTGLAKTSMNQSDPGLLSSSNKLESTPFVTLKPESQIGEYVTNPVSQPQPTSEDSLTDYSRDISSSLTRQSAFDPGSSRENTPQKILTICRQFQKIMDSTINNMYIEQNIILWNSRGDDHDVTEFFPRPRRTSRRPPTPEIELALQQEEVKHGEYAAHILLQKQTREYACAVEDSITLLRRGTEQISNSLTEWKGSPELFREISSHSYDNKCFNELTRIGSKVLFLSEAVKRLHDENAVAFWTSGHREAIFQLLVSFSKDSVKLRRKLGRIKDTLGERVRGIRQVVIKYGRETGVTENLIPPSIYHEWVREDNNLLETPEGQEGEVTKSDRKLGSVRKIMNNILTSYFRTPDGGTSDDDDDSKSQITASRSVTSKKYQMRKDIEILHKEEKSKAIDSTFEGVLGQLAIVPSSSNPITVVSTKESSRLEIRPWGGIEIISPSNIILKMITSNITPKLSCKNKSDQSRSVSENEDKELTNEAIWQQLTSEKEDETRTALEINEECIKHVDPSNDLLQVSPSRVHVVPTQNHNVPVLNSNEQNTLGPPLEDDQNNLNLPSADKCLTQADVKETTVIFTSDNPCSSGKEIRHLNEHNGSSTFLISANIIGATEDVTVISSEVPSQVPSSALFSLQPSNELATLFSSDASSVKNALSQSMMKQINDINFTIEDIHNVVLQTTYTIREVERSWLSPGQYINPKSRRQKELFQHLDFIADTVKLVNRPSFASRLYKEDQHEIVAVLDPVFREVTACYVTLCEFHDRVTVDTRYLKQLVSGFPKRSLVIQDWVSDPFIDETLGEMEEQHRYTTALDIDVEELFS
ncbi:hypothetical protein Ocin01_00561, partial [Orchesella cincta]